MTKKEIIERYGEEAYQRRLEYSKQYNQQYREEYKKYQRQYREQNKEAIKECHKQYNKQHRDEMKQYNQQHREEKKQWSRKNKCMFAFCIPEQIEQIENYELAKESNFNGWDIHHRLETHNSDGEKRLVNISVAELKALDMYYNRPAKELIFLTKSEHIKLHRKKQS